MISIDLRVGDRITVLPDKARSAHTRAVLTSRFVIEVTAIRPDMDGAVEVTGFLLTSRGAWRADPLGDPDPRVVPSCDPRR